jgi:hypothetical protein
LAETWEDVLDLLEAEVAALGSQLSGIPLGGEPAALTRVAAAWTPPSALGPLPTHLADRARALEAAQARTSLQLQEMRATAAQHLAALRAVPSPPRPAPVYLDVEG